MVDQERTADDDRPVRPPTAPSGAGEPASDQEIDVVDLDLDGTGLTTVSAASVAGGDSVGRDPASAADVKSDTQAVLRDALVLGRVRGVPVGTVLVTTAEISAAGGVAAAARRRLHERIEEHRSADRPSSGDGADGFRGLSGVGEDGLDVAVVIPTLGTHPHLPRTVAAVLAQSRPPRRLVVVDNGGAGAGAVARALAGIDDARLLVVDEPRPGASAARNRGLSLTDTEVIAFTDDDARPDHDWLANLVAPFAESESVTCVTGMALPGELRTQAQRLFEEFGGFDKGFDRRVWCTGPTDAGLGPRGEPDFLFPYNPGLYGSSLNMAVRRGLLGSPALFDPHLGAGAPPLGGEDLDLYLRVVLAGHVLVYEPRAIVWHSGRPDLPGLRRQVFGYGTGLTAAIAKMMLSDPRHALNVLRRVPEGVRRLLSPDSEKNAHRTSSYPAELTRLERLGLLAGPWRYLWTVTARRNRFRWP